MTMAHEDSVNLAPQEIPIHFLEEEQVDEWNQWRSENQEKKLDLSDIDLSSCNLEGANLEGANLKGANLKGANLLGTDLTSGEYFDIDQIGEQTSTNLVLSDVDLSNTELKLKNVELRNCNLKHTIINIENYFGDNIIQIDNCNLESAEFNFNRYSSKGFSEIQLNCQSCNFSYSHLTMYLFDKENCIGFYDCNFTESRISIEENNSNSNELSIEFSDCDFTNTNFCGSYFNYANLKGANLSTVKFYNIIFCNADLSGANLTNADLSGANLANANLTNADLSGADLTNANLEGIITDENTKIELPE